MKNGFTHVLLADNNDEERHFLKWILESLRIKTKVENVLALNWYCQTSGLNRDNFIFSL